MTSNGNLDSEDLEELSTPGKLRADAAAGYERVLDATGTTGTEGSLDAYRTYAQQEDIFTDRYQRSYCEYAPGKVDARTWEGETWYRKPGQAAAAVPGTSNHGWGKAVDFQNLGGYGSSSWERFADIAPDYGWSNAEGRDIDEPWHWVYDSSRDQHLEDDVELSDKVELSDDMRAISGWSLEAMSVGALLGHLSSSSWGTGKELDGAAALLASMATDLQTILHNQELIKEALADLTVQVDLELRPTIGPLSVELTGTVTDTEEPPAPEDVRGENPGPLHLGRFGRHGRATP